MATASLPFAGVAQVFEQLLAWFAPRPAPAPRLPAQRCVPAQRAKPLRVVRVVEPCASRAVAGRMVISGRMDDVCAELDRLAAQEARAH